MNIKIRNKLISITKTSLIGSPNRWNDNKKFDDFEDIPNLLQYQIEKIEIWRSKNYSPTTEVEGIQITTERFISTIRKLYC